MAIKWQKSGHPLRPVPPRLGGAGKRATALSPVVSGRGRRREQGAQYPHFSLGITPLTSSASSSRWVLERVSLAFRAQHAELRSRPNLWPKEVRGDRATRQTLGFEWTNISTALAKLGPEL